LKLLEIQIYSGRDVLDWIIFTGKDHAGKIHQGITFDQLQTANLDEVTRAAVNVMFDREQKYRRFELYDIYKKEGPPSYLKAENMLVIGSRYNQHLVPVAVREVNEPGLKGREPDQ